MALSGVLVSLGTIIAIYGLLALGLNVKFGYNGLLDIGHVAFYLVGAYLTALLVLPPAETQQFAKYILGWQWPWLPALAVGTVAAGLFGMLVALPAIRLREDYLAIAVLGVSVIVKRVVQTETWLGNGPDALRGWSPPLAELIPLPGTGLASAILLGLVVFVLWTVATYLVATVGNPVGTTPARRRIVRALLAVTTLGVGYWAARRGEREGTSPDLRFPALSGVVAGAGATGAAIAGAGATAVLLFFGIMSLFTWLFGAVVVARHYSAVARRDALVGFGLAVAFIAAFVPLIVLGGGTGDVMSSVGLVVTMGLLLAFLYGIYYLGNNWDRFGSGAGFVQVIGIGAAWLFALRYFLLALVEPFKQGGLATAIGNLIQNLLWLVKFAPAGARFDYARFLLVGTLAAVGAAYYLSEVTVRSPFGRVLKAIREDEDVATALGKNTFVFKIQSMILGSSLAGLAGGLSAIYFGALVHTMFAPRITFIVLLMIIIGGTANNRGVLLGAVIYWAFQKGTEDVAGFFPTAARSSVQALRLAFIGALLIVILYYRPEGIWGERRMGSSEVDG